MHCGLYYHRREQKKIILKTSVFFDILRLAKHSHLTLVKSADFRCGCCPQDMWKQVAKETAQGPLNCSSTQQQSMMLIDGGGNQQQHNQHHNVSAGSQPHGTQSVEDIIVKIEPHQMMTNGDDDESSSSRGASTTTHHTTSDGSIYSIVQQAAHGNHHQPANNYVNGGSIDAAGSSTSNTNDGFMLGLYYCILFLLFSYKVILILSFSSLYPFFLFLFYFDTFH